MKQDSPVKTLAWMATGAVVLAVGAFFGSVAGWRKKRTPAENGGNSGSGGDSLEDLTDRPVARAAVEESLAAARRVDSLSESVAGLEARLQSVERSSSAERVEAVWQRVLQLEERLERVQQQLAEAPAVETLVAETENRLSPRLRALETRVDEHHAAIQQLQAHASQTEANMQKMIAAVEKLTDQISRAFPPAAIRMDPKRGPASGQQGTPQGGTQGGLSSGPGMAAATAMEPSAAVLPQPYSASERISSLRWGSLTLAGAITLSLAGSWAMVRREASARARPAIAGAGFPAHDHVDASIGSWSQGKQKVKPLLVQQPKETP